MIRHTKINTRSDSDPLQFFKNDYRKFYERYQTIRSPYESDLFEFLFNKHKPKEYKIKTNDYEYVGTLI